MKIVSRSKKDDQVVTTYTGEEILRRPGVYKFADSSNGRNYRIVVPDCGMVSSHSKSYPASHVLWFCRDQYIRISELPWCELLYVEVTDEEIVIKV